jgi:hypothetical protein
MLSPTDRLRNAIQRVLTEEGDGWMCGHFVLALGLEKMVDGVIESTAWVWSPADQPEWISDGLLRAAADLRQDSDIDTD